MDGSLIGSGQWPVRNVRGVELSLIPQPTTKPGYHKWIPAEDSLLIELRAQGMNWKDISKRLVGRSDTGCRLRYQNHLETPEWDEQMKNTLAQRYKWLKQDMWSKIADDMCVPWSDVEAMAWKLGKAGLNNRFDIQPFSNAISIPQLAANYAPRASRSNLAEQYSSPFTQLPSFKSLLSSISAYKDGVAQQPRSSPNVKLNNKVAPWLTKTLERLSRLNHQLENGSQHTQCLIDTLSFPEATWNLCSIMFPNVKAGMCKGENASVIGPVNFQIIHIEAFIVQIDMVWCNKVVFKLTTKAIEALIDYHMGIYLAQVSANSSAGLGNQTRLEILHKDFGLTAKKFVYCTNAKILQNMEEDGSGELPCDHSEQVKNAIWNLFLPLLPPGQMTR